MNETGSTHLPQCSDDSSLQLLNTDSDVRFWINIVIVPICVIFGITGNVLSFIVIDRITFGLPSSKTLVKALATFDIMYLAGSLLFQTMRTIQYDTDWLGEVFIYPYLHPVVWPYMTTTQTIATWIIVVIATDRYVAIEFPFKALSICTAAKARLAVKIIIGASVVFNFPHCFEYKWEDVSNPCTSDVIVDIVPTDLFMNRAYQIAYWSVLTLLLRFVLPLTALCVLTVCLLGSIDKARKRQRPQASAVIVNRCSRKDGVTPVLLAVVVSFLLCQSTEFVMHILTTLRWTNATYRENENTTAQQIANTVGNLLLVVSASINFILYLAFAKSFQSAVKQLLCSKVHCVNSVSASTSVNDYDLQVREEIGTMDNPDHARNLGLSFDKRASGATSGHVDAIL